MKTEHVCETGRKATKVGGWLQSLSYAKLDKRKEIGPIVLKVVATFRATFFGRRVHQGMYTIRGKASCTLT